MRRISIKIKYFEKLNDGINLLLLSLIVIILYLSRPVSIFPLLPHFFVFTKRNQIYILITLKRLQNIL